MIDFSNYSCDKCKRAFSRHCNNRIHTLGKPPTKFKPKNIFARAIKEAQELDAVLTECKTPEFRKSTPPPAPNPNYVPPLSVTRPRPTVYVMKREELVEWVKTKAQIGDVAYYYDRSLERAYMYCYRKPDDNPFWRMIDPEFVPDYVKKESKGDNKMNITGICTYSTPCGWCTKWDKKCDKKIGRKDEPIRNCLNCANHGKSFMQCDWCDPDNNFEYFQAKEN